MTAAAGASRTLAGWIAATTYDDLPPAVIAVTRKALLDGIGVILAAGTLGEGCRAFVDLAIEGGGKQESSILGFRTKVPAYMAAFANGAMSHALDFEDIHEAALVHSNAAAIPAALAMAEALGADGKRLLTALALGSEIVCRLGLSFNKDPLKSGWYAPPILEAFGATAACAKLLQLNEDQTLDALSLCLYQATCSAEFIANPHSVLRGIRDAFGAKTGVLSALLARAGTPGVEQPMEGKAGLFGLYSGGDFDNGKLIGDLGRRFASAEISFKPWPSCRGTHAYIEAALDLARDDRLQLFNVEQVVVSIPREGIIRILCDPLPRKRHPQTLIDAKFSIPFCVATALVHGDVGLRHFSAENLANTDVAAVADRISYEFNEEADWRQATQGAVRVRLKGGKIRQKSVDVPYGNPAHPISDEGLIAKFRECASYAPLPLSSSAPDRIIEMILHLERVENIALLTADF